MFALPVAPDSIPKEPLALPPMPYLLQPLTVVASLSLEVRRKILAQHVGLYEPVTARRRE